MNLRLLLFIALLLPSAGFSQVPSFLAAKGWSELWNEDEDDMPVDPGYWEQYYRMKKDKDGKIPRLPYATIQEHELNTVNRDQQLFNIQELGPKNFGGRTRAILLDADNRDHIFSAGISGGIWFSADSGDNWIPVNDFLGSLAVSSLAQDHFNHDIIYAGTGEAAGNSAGIPGNGVYRSTDHGLSFQALPSLKHRTGSLWGLLALALIFGGAAQAAQTAKPKSTKTVTQKAPASHENSGTITSIDATRLVMSSKVQGKNEQLTFVLTPETKREGTLTTGNKVTVKSHLENADEIATLVRGQTTAAKTKGTSTGKKS